MGYLARMLSMTMVVAQLALAAEGRLVGVNFDRVWENVANDFGYNPDVARNVSTDVRYLLWLLTAAEGATGLVTELTAPAK